MILHCLPRCRPVETTDITDLTASVRTDRAKWFACEEHADPPGSNCLDMPLTPEPSEEEAAAIRRRLVTSDTEEEQHLITTLAAAENPDTPEWAQPLLRDILSRFGE